MSLVLLYGGYACYVINGIFDSVRDPTAGLSQVVHGHTDLFSIFFGGKRSSNIG